MADYIEAPANATAAQRLMVWIDNRFPATKLWNEHVGEYYAPKNFNFWYIFGSLSLVVLVMQIITGIFLTMHYKPDASLAFASVEYIMRDVPWGWLIRYMHSTGASAFFIVVYLHMFRGLLYGSYRKPRELVWIFGCGIFLCLMAEAFMGYLLPWGQMSYWGAQVIINLFAAVPFIGPDLALLKGRFSNVGKIVLLVGAVVLIALLNTFDAKFWGVVVMGGAVVILFFLPWLDHSPVKSIRYRPSWHKYVYGVFVFFFLVLGYLGAQPPSATGNYVSQVGTLLYFAFFLLMPWWSRMGEFKPVPERVTYAAH